MFKKKDIEQALHKKSVLSPDLQAKRTIWRNLYKGEADWNNDDTPSLNLAYGICAETARAVTAELVSEVTGSVRADYLNRQYQRVLNSLVCAVERCCAGGEVIFRPFVRHGEIHVTVVESDCYYPTSYNELGALTGVVFSDTVYRDNFYYTLLEDCVFANNAYVIEYTCWKSKDAGTLGVNIAFEDAPSEWSDLPPRIEWQQANQPWFAVFTMPSGGYAQFARAVDLIKEVEKQFSRILWEYSGGELAVDAAADLFRVSGNSGVKSDGYYKKYVLPEGKDRLFRLNHGESGNEMHVFSPPLRDESLFNGFNQILRRIEFVSGLYSGAVSDPQNVDKTATEIKSSKQRFYQTVSSIQTALETALTLLVAILNDMTDRYSLSKAGKYSLSFFWDDSILKTQEEKMAEYDAELKRLILLHNMNVVTDAELRAFVIENSDYFSKLTPQMVEEAAEQLAGTAVFEE